MPMLSTLTKSGNQPNIHILDNDASSILKQGLIKHNIQYQLVPTHLHRHNEAKRTIQTSKVNFIKCLYAAQPNYNAK